MPNKTPPKSANVKKQGKSIKEKRAAKKAKGDDKSTMMPPSSRDS